MPELADDDERRARSPAPPQQTKTDRSEYIDCVELPCDADWCDFELPSCDLPCDVGCDL